MRALIGITGTLGAGKGTVVSYLLYRKEIVHYSVSGFITEEVERRGLPVNRDSMRNVANDLREKFGPTYIIRTLYERAHKECGGEQGIIIESLRALGEVRCIKELGGFVIGVDADQRIRYRRALARKSVKDGVTYEEFIAQEHAEMNESDPFKQNLCGVLKEADIVLCNNGIIEDFYSQIDSALAMMKGRDARA